MTEIEAACFKSTRAHWVSSICCGDKEISVVLHPSNEEQSKVSVAFTEVSGMRIDTSHNEGEISFPLDIIGFESQSLEDNRWAFILHTDMVEFSFHARWPNIQAGSGCRTPLHGIASA